MKKTLVAASAALVLGMSVSSFAQSNDSGRSIYMGAGFGLSNIVQNGANDNGANSFDLYTLALGMHMNSKPLSAEVQFATDGFSQTVLANLFFDRALTDALTASIGGGIGWMHQSQDDFFAGDAAKNEFAYDFGFQTHYKINDSISLVSGYQWVATTNNADGSSWFNKDHHDNRYTVGVHYALNM